MRIKSKTIKLPVFCGKDCGGGACPLLAEVEDGRVVRVYNNPAGGKYLKGCRRGFNLPQETYAEERILHPLIRSGERGSGRFRQVDWGKALDYISQRLLETREKHGANSILCMASAGTTSAVHGTVPLLTRFLNLFGGCTTLESNYSNGAAMYALPFVLGEDWKRAGFDAATMQYSQMIILWGANVLEARLGTEVPQRLLEAKKRAAQIVAIDPRRTTTVEHASTWWIPCRPGGDAALMLAVLHVLISEGFVDRPFINSHSVGFEQLEAYILGSGQGLSRTPQWAADLCGVPAEEITRFARAYAAARPAMLFPGYSIQRVFAGEETYRLAVALQVATGNFGIQGGSTGSINNRLPVPHVGCMEVPSINDQPEIPILRWPDAVIEGRSGGYPSDIHAIYNVGSNFINQGSDVRKNIAAFQKVDFTVSHELFLTPTAQYCDVILPVASPLEKEDIGIPWLGNYLLYRPQVVQPLGEACSDYDIFCDLAERMDFYADYSCNRSAAEWVQYFLDQSEVPDHEAFRSTGIYLAPDQERTGMAEFSADPAGHPLRTPSGRVELASEAYHRETGFPAIPTWQEQLIDERYPLKLITPKSIQRTHSQGGSIDRVRKGGNHALEMNPQDAGERGIIDGDMVKVFNDAGTSIVEVRLNKDIMTGVVCIEEGIWLELDSQGNDLAGSANMFTSTQGTAPGTACIMHGMGVEVIKETRTIKERQR